jgi:hypothetical protein
MIEVEFDPKVCRPKEEPSEVRATFVYPSTASLTPVGEDCQVVGSSPGYFVLSTFSNQTEVTASLSMPHLAPMELSVPIPRILVELVLSPASRTGWSNQIQKAWIGDLAGPGPVVLRVLLQGLAQPIRGSATLHLRATRQYVVSSVKDGRVDFSISEFSDSLHSLKSEATFCLTLELEGHDRPEQMPVLRVETRWTVTEARCFCRFATGQAVAELQWSESGPRPKRYLLLRWLRKPWRDPINIPIADGQTRLTIDMTTIGLEAGLYLGEFAFDDPWSRSTAQPVHPPAHSDNRSLFWLAPQPLVLEDFSLTAPVTGRTSVESRALSGLAKQDDGRTLGSRSATVTAVTIAGDATNVEKYPCSIGADGAFSAVIPHDISTIHAVGVYATGETQGFAKLACAHAPVRLKADREVAARVLEVASRISGLGVKVIFAGRLGPKLPSATLGGEGATRVLMSITTGCEVKMRVVLQNHEVEARFRANPEGSGILKLKTGSRCGICGMVFSTQDEWQRHSIKCSHNSIFPRFTDVPVEVDLIWNVEDALDSMARPFLPREFMGELKTLQRLTGERDSGQAPILDGSPEVVARRLVLEEIRVLEGLLSLKGRIGDASQPY